ncbi:MAG: M67 family metallopeptidase [Actinomycetota bacterium]
MIAFDGALVTEMTEHARREFPNEACGIVAGAAGRPVKVFPMRNADRSPSRYRLDPREQLAVFDELDREGWDLLAIFHSHPTSAAYPSETDRRLAHYPQALHVLVSLVDPTAPEVRAFRIADDAVVEEEVEVA